MKPRLITLSIKKTFGKKSILSVLPLAALPALGFANDNISNTAEPPLEEVVVIGQAAAQAKALKLQKEAKALKAMLTADDIGQLPDQNVAEALQRVSGVSLQRDQGEGRFISIRGIDPGLNQVTVNGLAIPSPESDTRGVALDVIPSELVQQLVISKSVTPDMDASAVGGAVEVKSLSAFDAPEQSFSIRAHNGFNELTEENSPKLGARFTDVFSMGDFGDLGVATAVSFQQRNFGTHNVESTWADLDTSIEGVEGIEEVTLPEEIEQRHYQIRRERLGVALNLDLQTSDEHAYYWRTLWSKFSDDEYRLRNQFEFEESEEEDGEIEVGSVIENAQSAPFSARIRDGKVKRTAKDRFEEQTIFSSAFGGEHQFDGVKLTYRLGYSKSQEVEPGRTDIDFKAKGIDYGYLNSDRAIQIAASDEAMDLSNYELDEVEYQDNRTEDDMLSVRFDLTHQLSLSNMDAEFQWGAKFTQREKFNNTRVRVFDGFGEEEITANTFATNTIDYSLGDFGSGLSRSQINQFIDNNLASFEEDSDKTLEDTFGDSYNTQEDVTAAYAMFTTEWKALTAVMGIRFEKTEYANQAYSIGENEDGDLTATPISLSNDYQDFFPSVNLRYAFTDTLQSRFSYTETLARPKFSDASARRVEDDDELELGNPLLKPYESNNVDWSIEYYPSEYSVLSAGLFYKDIGNFIDEAEVQDTPEWIDEGYDEVKQPVNGGEAELTGLELAWSHRWDSGFLASANSTWVDASRDLPRQADRVANLMIGYENDALSLRLSTANKTRTYIEPEGDDNRYQDTYTQMDFSGKYAFSESLQAYVNVSNLTDEAVYIYQGSPSFNAQYDEFGRTFEIGVTYRNF